MAQVSRAKRKLRRLKRENSLIYRMFNQAIVERNVYRDILEKALEAEQAKVNAAKEQCKVPALVVETPDPETEVSAPFVQINDPESEGNFDATEATIGYSDPEAAQ